MKLISNKLKESKGFTMMEIIVVLVIIGILAAVSIPSMIGFINDAKGKAYMGDARIGMVAAQTILTEKKASDSEFETSSDIFETGGSYALEFELLVSGVSNPTGFSDFTFNKDGTQVVGLTYDTGKGYRVIVNEADGVVVEEV